MVRTGTAGGPPLAPASLITRPWPRPVVPPGPPGPDRGALRKQPCLCSCLGTGSPPVPPAPALMDPGTGTGTGRGATGPWPGAGARRALPPPLPTRLPARPLAPRFWGLQPARLHGVFVGQTPRPFARGVRGTGGAAGLEGGLSPVPRAGSRCPPGCSACDVGASRAACRGREEEEAVRQRRELRGRYRLRQGWQCRDGLSRC